MNIYIVRHAEPDYSIDSLTEKGWREAALLGKRLEKITPAYYYVSPLGRAKDTASLTLRAVGASAEEMDWLREFDHGYRVVQRGHASGLAWDILPADWAQEPVYYDPERWSDGPLYRDTTVRTAFDAVGNGLDALLAKHGYVRDGRLYRAERPNHDNLILFCHFGVTCVLLSHLLGISPMVLWHGVCSLPTSVTILNTEERREGITSFRMSAFGDTSHLYAAGREPSFSGRFCETYENWEQRHD